ncbi:hypothetical protein Tco_0104731 [Tanacetum coccineum]
MTPRVQACYEHPTRDLSRPPSPTLLTNLPHSVPREAPPQLAPLLNHKLSSSPYGYCKNLKKTVKTGQTRTRERKENTRAGRMLSKRNAPLAGVLNISPRLLLVNPKEMNHAYNEGNNTGKKGICAKTYGKKAQRPLNNTDCSRWQSW